MCIRDRVETDHRPLQSINKPLHQAPARLQRFLLQLQKYDLQVTYKPGKYLHVADTLSRSNLQETKEQLVPETEINAINPRSYVPISPEKYAQFQRETAKDLQSRLQSSGSVQFRVKNSASLDFETLPCLVVKVNI